MEPQNTYLSFKMCSPVQLYYSFIHAFSMFTRGYCGADVLAQTERDRETHSRSHLWAIFSLQFTWHVFVRMRGNWNTWRKPTEGKHQGGLEEDLDPDPAIRNWFMKAWGPHCCFLKSPNKHCSATYGNRNLLRLISRISVLLLKKTHNNDEQMSIFSKSKPTFRVYSRPSHCSQRGSNVMCWFVSS